ncbi:MAG: hypothetical protein PHC88_16405, partial [Terrimicrobiaceae bacterium]|nr:hypothetical protein [Terrimicrobiaceae bacterium]
MFIKTRKWTSLLAAVLIGGSVGVGSSWAQAAAPAATPAPTPTIVTRVADLEAYVTNGAPSTTQVGPLGATSGPGHNAWMMTSAAFVLMMT